jgi:hypothetical protein
MALQVSTFYGIKLSVTIPDISEKMIFYAMWTVCYNTSAILGGGGSICTQPKYQTF